MLQGQRQSIQLSFSLYIEHDDKLSDRAGLGFTTAQILVRKGAKVYIAGHNAEKAASCIQKINDQGTGPGNGQAIFHHLDLEDPKGTKASAQEFMKIEDRLDVLGEYCP